MAAPITIAVLGAGHRGTGYSNWALKNPGKAKIVAVAEPRDFWRNRIVSQHGVSAEHVFTDWRQVASKPRLADAVIISTQDDMHVEPAVAMAAKGYHILLEKPMAPSEAGCRTIHQAVKASGAIFAVCHVMRYTAYTRALKQFVQRGLIGDVVSIQHLEPVGWWHQAHSFVRGNWRNEKQSSFMLLAKSCHDIDWIKHIVGKDHKRVSSAGGLMHFTAANRPAGAADRCLDCPISPKCPYSAVRIYLNAVRKGKTGWPVDVVADEPSEQSVTEALRTGPYGRCVYACDNDVVDHQTVNIEFQDGASGVFTMTAFTQGGGRQTRLFGTKGVIEGDGDKIRHFDYLSEQWQTLDTNAAAADITGGHGGGDQGIMEAFSAAVAANDPSLVLSGPDETLQTHLAVFAAERARRNATVEEVKI